jgi:hypothetical protein
VNVKVFPLNDAVVKDKLVEVNKLAVAASKLLTLWSFDCVYALNDAVVAKLPVSIVAATTLTLKVDASPFVKVIVLPTADAVTKLKLAEVNRDDVAEFKLVTDVFNDAVVEFIFVIDVFTLALFVLRASILIC